MFKIHLPLSIPTATSCMQFPIISHLGYSATFCLSASSLAYLFSTAVRESDLSKVQFWSRHSPSPYGYQDWAQGHLGFSYKSPVWCVSRLYLFLPFFILSTYLHSVSVPQICTALYWCWASAQAHPSLGILFPLPPLPPSPVLFLQVRLLWPPKSGSVPFLCALKRSLFLSWHLHIL